MRTKLKGLIGGVHYMHDFIQTCLIFGSSVNLPGGDQVDGLPPAPSIQAQEDKCAREVCRQYQGETIYDFVMVFHLISQD